MSEWLRQRGLTDSEIEQVQRIQGRVPSAVRNEAVRLSGEYQCYLNDMRRLHPDAVQRWEQEVTRTGQFTPLAEMILGEDGERGRNLNTARNRAMAAFEDATEQAARDLNLTGNAGRGGSLATWAIMDYTENTGPCGVSMNTTQPTRVAARPLTTLRM